MAERIALLQTCKQYFLKQDYDCITVSFADAGGMNDFVLANNMCVYKVNDIAFILSKGGV
ncbi:MAG: hypothetical protein KAT90_15960 [Gammaproteobacteria bacterium]|nr:hypothetical protein [Gammaproteobacteria bacterium]